MLVKPAALKTHQYFKDYSLEKGIYLKTAFVNAEHVHALIDLPTSNSIEQVVQLYKGSSSHWINDNRLLRGKFFWGRGYGAFSVSHSHVDLVARYIEDQEEHHRKRTFTDELRTLVRKYGLTWHDD